MAPPPPDVAQNHLYERLGLLLPKQVVAEDTLTTTSSLGGSSGFSSYTNGEHHSDGDSLSPVTGRGKNIELSITA